MKRQVDSSWLRRYWQERSNARPCESAQILVIHLFLTAVCRRKRTLVTKLGELLHVVHLCFVSMDGVLCMVEYGEVEGYRRRLNMFEL